MVCVLLLSGISITTVPAAVPANTKTAIEEAARNGQYLLLTFYKTKDASFSALSTAVDNVSKTPGKKVAIYNAQFNDPANAEIAGKYGVKLPDLPVLLVIAPNGVITGGYRQQTTVEQLQKNIAMSELMLKVMKPLQEQKIALVALQNKSTKLNSESWKGINDLVSDPQYKSLVEAIKADPAADSSADFMQQCKLLNTMNEATVVVLLPPGRIGAILNGKLTKADVLKAIQSCASGSSCGLSSSSGSCGPSQSSCSDRRFKKEITPITSALSNVLKLQGVSFTWDRAAFPARKFPEGRNIGLIAQDVERVIPEVVRTDMDGYKSIEYDKLVAVLIESIKEMKQQVNRQDAFIAEQQAKIRKLEERK